MFRIKRAYEPAAPEDGFRVLVDGLWPRGLSKKDAGIDEWLRDIAPSAELRTVVQVPGDHSLRTDVDAVAAAAEAWLTDVLRNV